MFDRSEHKKVMLSASMRIFFSRNLDLFIPFRSVKIYIFFLLSIAIMPIFLLETLSCASVSTHTLQSVDHAQKIRSVNGCLNSGGEKIGNKDAKYLVGRRPEGDLINMRVCVCQCVKQTYAS